jgi:hypothetical protein
MTDVVTYYVALPFIAPDDGTAAGEPTECSNPVAVVMTAEALLRKEGHVGAAAFSRTDGCPPTRRSTRKTHRYRIERWIALASSKF